METSFGTPAPAPPAPQAPTSILPEDNSPFQFPATAPPQKREYQEQELRSFTDVQGLRDAIYREMLAAAEDMPPARNSKYTLRVTKPTYLDPPTFTLKQQKEALLQGKTLGRRLQGVWELVDNATDQVVDSKTGVLARVPFLTDRGTVIYNGSHYAIGNQDRLNAGAFTRQQQNGEIESFLNVLPGQGQSHRYFVDPAKGVFYTRVHQSQIPMLPLLRALGAKDDELKEAWGEDILRANQQHDKPEALRKLLAAFGPKNAKPVEQPSQALAEIFRKMKTNPDVTERTLGARFENLDLPMLMAATKKLLRVSKGEEETDERDNLAYQTIMPVEKLLAERWRLDSGKTRRSLLWKMTRKGNLSKMPVRPLEQQLQSVLLSSGLGQNLEETNTSELLDKLTRLSKMGEGGLPSVDSAPSEARSVQPSYTGYIDPMRTSESMKAGLELQLASGARMGPDNRIYRKFQRVKDGAQVWRSPHDLADSVVAFSNELDDPTASHIIGLDRGRLQYVDRNRAEYIVPQEDSFSPLANMIPLKSGISGQRLVMGSRMTTQALPIIKGEAPLVQSAVPGTNEQQSYDQHFTKHLGSLTARQAGVVESVMPDKIRVRYEDGQVEDHELYQHFPFNRKTSLHQTAVVKPGQPVTPNQVLARSNFTDEQGNITTGLNARIGYMTYPGNYEDAIVVSEGFAKKAVSDHLYQHNAEWSDPDVRRGKSAYRQLFPQRYLRDQLDLLDDDGVVQPGATVQPGQPLVLMAKTRDQPKNRLIRPKQASFADQSLTWDYEDPGVVQDVSKTEDGVTVTVTAARPLRVGDKLSARYANKGVVGKIIPDEKMPHDEEGRPLEILMNDLGVTTRCYDDQTEVWVLGQGWKLVVDLLPDDQILCLHPVHHHLLFCRQTAMPFLQEYDGPLHVYNDAKTSLAVTPEHSFMYRLSRKLPDLHWKIGTVRDILPSRVELPTTGYGGLDSPAALPVDLCGLTGESFVRLAAWTVVTLRRGGNHHQRTHLPLRIPVKEKLRQQMWEELTAGQIPLHRAKSWWQVKDSRLSALLRNVGCCESEPRIPAWVNHLALPLRLLFAQTVWKALGATGDKLRFGKTRLNKLRSDLELLWLLCGRTPQLTAWKNGNSVLSVSERTTTTLRPGAWKTEHYQGRIACPSVPTGLVVTRRLGKIVVAGNTNPSVVAEAWLGKIAAKRGKPFKVEDWKPGRSNIDWVMEELKQANVKPYETLYDPELGRKIPNIATGVSWIMRLHHLAEDKEQGRGISGGYSSSGEPAKGGGEESSKRLSLLELNALLARGAYHNIRGTKLISGQKNDDWWLAYMQGHNPPDPATPFVFQKMIEDMKGSGINVVRKGGNLQLLAMTDDDVDQLAGDREVRHGATVNFDTDLTPIPGGLFDQGLTGSHGGNRWSKIKLHEPFPNPVFEDPIRHLLNLTGPQFRKVLSGEEKLNGKVGPGAIAKALGEINVPQALVQARQDIASGRKGKRDQAIRKLGYLKNCQETGIHPSKWMLKSVPVLPPQFRPVSQLGSSKTPLVSDSNYLYRQLLESNDNLRELQDQVGEDHIGEERLAVYDSFSALTGLTDPKQTELVEKGVSGILAGLFGDGPKYSAMQRRLLSTPTDVVGRAVVIPNPELDMDSIGLPENRAWNVYGPMVIRRLAQEGMPRSEAMRHLKDQSTSARRALQQEMERRPVLVSRAPVLHKYGIQAFWPRLTKGHSVEVSPLITAVMTMDFDGDMVNYKVPVTDDEVEEASERMLPSRNLISPADFKTPVFQPRQEMLGGLFKITRKARAPKPSDGQFGKIADAIAAYRRGELRWDSVVDVAQD